MACIAELFYKLSIFHSLNQIEKHIDARILFKV